MNHSDDPEAASQAQTPRQIPRRVARPVIALAPAVILADTSASMLMRDGRASDGEALAPRRIDRLAKVLDYLLTRVRVRSLICFNDFPFEVPLLGQVMLPEPDGSTALDVALTHVGGLAPKPLRCCVLSDGLPNSIEATLRAARQLRPMIIDAYYVGPEGAEHMLRFMADLAACGGPGGRSGHFDMVDPKLLGTELERRLLTGPRG